MLYLLAKIYLRCYNGKKAKEWREMIITKVEGLRDPFLLQENGVYYLYGTGVAGDWDNTTWDCYVNRSGDLGRLLTKRKLICTLSSVPTLLNHK